MSWRPPHRLSRRWIPVAVVMLIVANISNGCNRSEPNQVALDLAASWTTALVSVESAQLDIGTDEARPFLGNGWYYDERNRDSGETFVWSRGASSEFFFHLGWQRDLSVEITCRPFQFPGATPQTLSIELNGQPIGQSIELDPPMSRYSIELPAAAQVVGRNRLVAMYGRVDAPATVTAGSRDERELGVAWSRVQFHSVDHTPVQTMDGTIVMPAGTRADHFLDLTPGSLLTIEDCEPMGETPSLLEISVRGELDAEPETTTLACDGGPLILPLETREGLTRIRLTTRPRDDVGIPTGIRIHGSRVLSPQLRAQNEQLHQTEGEPRSSRPNVIIYLVDALRADRLGVYGCERPLSPRLDALAAEGVTFTDVVAQSSWTKAAVASIFTGLWPRAHGVNGPDDRLPDRMPTLPELVQAAGYQTGAVVANAYVGRPFGFARGFDYFEFIEHSRGRSEVIHERVAAWLDARANTIDPFFLYVHTIDPHAPYAPPTPYLETFASSVEDPTVGQVETVRGLVLGTVEETAELERDLRDLYDAEVAANDASFGRLLDELDRLGELENTLVVFTSDHGEAFGEHGTWTHGLDLFNEVLSIPLVMRLPNSAGAGQRVSTVVQHIDLLPTILGLCSIVSPVDLPGAVLVDATGTVRVGTDRTIFAYLDYWGKTGATALRDGWKLIQPLSADFGPEIELYRHDNDRVEANDFASRSPVRSGWLLAQLAVALRGEGTSLTIDVDAETRAQLEALGYMH
jgi:arylsulfatase A-like enzyme